jgi:alginate O-acetyltransferase complex protein AlgI
VTFSTPLFLYGFLPLVLAVYHLLPRRARNGWLVVASYGFYGWGNPLYLLLLLFSTLLDFGCALGMAGGPSGGRRRALLLVSIVVNLGVLAFFKYTGFFAQVSHDLVGVPGAEVLHWAGGIVLPLGISFYTFQTLSYTIDVYRGQVEPTRRFIDFAAYVAMFPQLVAGPIVRFSLLADALRHRRESRAQFSRGIGWLVIGLAKKLLLANPCGWVADQAFGAAELDVATAWTGLLAYAFQIYYDFSGYSEMAIGLGLMMGFTLPVNFNAPYRAASISEFWRRWHITLGSWVRDYLYLPLGGNRKGQARTIINLVLVMVLVGLWHGAAWQFVTWGAVHGILLALERLARPLGLRVKIPVVLRVALTFVVICLTWVVFRADSVAEAAHYYAALFGGLEQRGPAWWTGELVRSRESAVILGLAALVCWAGIPAGRFVANLNRWKSTVLTVLFWICLVVMGSQGGNPFLYYFF